jgi:predicted nucleic acid-binding protein
MICLDTNVISEFGRNRVDPAVSTWLANAAPELLRIPTPVVMELAFGAELFRLANRTRRYFERIEELKEEYAGRFLPFTDESVELCGQLRARRRNVGRPISVPDAMIAAICIANGATLATRNAADFADLDLKLIDPFEPA